MHSILRASVPKRSQKWGQWHITRHSSSLSLARLRKRIDGYLKSAHQVTNDPIWTVIHRLRWENHDYWTRQALEQCRISHDDFLRWKPVVFSPSLGVSLDMLGSSATASSPVPAWVVLSLACHKVRTPSEAQDKLLKLTYGNMATIDAQYKPFLHVLTTQSLAHLGIIVPMRQLVDSFLFHTMQDSPFHFNKLLHALSYFARSTEAAHLALTVLEVMTSRQIPLWFSTYSSLMKDRFVTLELTKHLHARMIHERVSPSAAHLEAYLRIFSHHGAIHEAGTYLKAIREYCVQHGLTPPPGRITEDASHPQIEGGTHPANTLYLKSMRNDRASAFHYLHNLLKLGTQGHRDITSSKQLPVDRHRHPPSTTFWGVRKQAVDIYDWTTALVSVANDRKITTSQLIHLFENARKKTKAFRPTIATYTVLLRGLLWRKAWGQALDVWNQLTESGLVLDRKALTVGVQVLTRAGHPQAAFYLLDSFATHHLTEESHLRIRSHPVNSPLFPQPTTGGEFVSSNAHLTARWINIVVINEFLVALLRVRRPDIIFMIWDNLELLYGVLPDNVTLNILLKSALLAVKMDRESVRGTMAHFTLQAPFHARQQSTSELEDVDDKREAVARNIMEALERSEPPPVVGIWRGRAATEVAREIFRGMVLGNWPPMQHIQAPVTAIRPPGKEVGPIAPIMELAKSLVVGLSHKTATGQADSGSGEHAKPLDSQVVLRAGAIPTVYPTKSTFLAYIKLLGLSSSSYTHEIPLALAWMRHLSILPSRPLLSISLVFWAEVGLRGPIFEEWAEKGGYSEYGRLETWMREWCLEVQRNAFPSDRDMSRALFMVARMRDRNFDLKRSNGTIRTFRTK